MKVIFEYSNVEFWMPKYIIIYMYGNVPFLKPE